MLILADRGFFSYILWRQACATGADLLWRIRTDPSGPKPTHVRDLDDGSWLAHLRALTPAAARREEPMLGRVIDYSIDDGRDNPTVYRLFTTITDPDQASAADLAAAYTERWEIETTFDEVKTHQRGPPDRAALQIPRPRPARDLGPPVLPLRCPVRRAGAVARSPSSRYPRFGRRQCSTWRCPSVSGRRGTRQCYYRTRAEGDSRTFS